MKFHAADFTCVLAAADTCLPKVNKMHFWRPESTLDALNGHI